MDMDNCSFIAVTGFGPFDNSDGKNLSWEAVSELPANFGNHKIEKFHVPVAYKEVDKVVTDIWDKKPHVS